MSEVVKLVGEDGFTKEIAVPDNQHYLSLPTLTNVRAQWLTEDTKLQDKALGFETREFKRSHRDERGQWIFKETPSYKPKQPKCKKHEWSFIEKNTYGTVHVFGCHCGATKKVHPKYER